MEAHQSKEWYHSYAADRLNLEAFLRTVLHRVVRIIRANQQLSLGKYRLFILGELDLGGN
jgi:hypothetical protein